VSLTIPVFSVLISPGLLNSSVSLILLHTYSLKSLVQDMSADPADPAPEICPSILKKRTALLISGEFIMEIEF
jgi:hypothetical protein